MASKILYRLLVVLVFLQLTKSEIDQLTKKRPVTDHHRSMIEEIMTTAEDFEDWEEIGDILEANDNGEKYLMNKRLFYQDKTSIVDTVYSSYKNFFGLGKSKGICSVQLFSQIIPKDYKYQTHQVVTEDGYIINMFRLHKKKSISPNIGGPVIYLQHGLSASADSWVLHHENEALGLMLVNAGFDVWLGNARATKYSYNHKWLNPDSKEYWAFSWQQMAMNDIVSSLKYIQNKTGVE